MDLKVNKMGKNVEIGIRKRLRPRVYCHQKGMIPLELEKRMNKVFSKIQETEHIQMLFMGRDYKGIIAKIESLIKKLEKGTTE
jgi:hypothetical protein